MLEAGAAIFSPVVVGPTREISLVGVVIFVFRMAAREGCWRALGAAALGDIALCEKLKDKYADAFNMCELQIY